MFTGSFLIKGCKKETLAQVFSCEFLRIPFLHNTSGRLPLLLAFCCNLTKMGTANSVLKTSVLNILYLETLTLEVPFRYISFLSRLHFHLFTLFTVRSSHRSRGASKKRCSLKFCKINRKPPVLESLINGFAGLTPIFESICQVLLLYCIRITRCYLSVLLYI